MTTNSTKSVSSSTTSTSSKRLSGLMSGLDTDTLVSQLTSGTQSKIDKIKQNRQIALWRQDSYQEVTSALKEFKNTYFSSTGSSSSISSKSFFNVSTITNSSTCLNVSGDSTVAEKMVITGITQLAKQASFNSNHKVSTEAIASGVIKDSWSPNSISGDSITINYNGTDYKVALDSDFVFNTTDDISKITDNLNDAISKIDGLKGHIAFSKVDGVVNIKNVPLTSTTGFYIKDGTENLLSGLGLTKSTVAGTSIVGGTVDTDDFFKNELAAGSTLDFTIDGEEYTLDISTAVSLSPDATTKEIATALQTALTKEIAANSDLKDKLSVTIGNDGAVSLSCTGAAWSITGGSKSILNGLGLSDNVGVSYTTSNTATGTANRTELIKTYLSDSLSGSTLTFSLNGVSKNITFKESEKSQYSTAADLATYLQTKLTSSYGSDKVTVSQADGVLSFGTTDATSVLALTSCDATGILGKSGALHIYAGETNRISTAKTLEDISDNLSTKVVPQTNADTYGITVNGKDFVFAKSTKLSAVISTINNDTDANVTISYSSVTDTFSVEAKNGGEKSQVSISDLGGSNLATALFGTATTNYTVEAGQDAKMNVSFDGNAAHAIEVVRSENDFSLDGVNITLLSKTDASAVNATSPIQFTVKNNVDDLADKLKKFVEDYNNIISLTSGKVKEAQDTDEKYLPLTASQEDEMSESEITNWNKKAKVGLLQGDTILNSLVTSFRHAMTDQVSSVQSALYKLGISTTDYSSNGKLTINEDTLKKALSDDPTSIATMFTGDDGIASRLQTVINKHIGTTGIDGILILKAGEVDSSSTDQSALADLVSDYDDKIDDLEDRLETQQEYYYSKFTALETYISQMNSQASWFSTSST